MNAPALGARNWWRARWRSGGDLMWRPPCSKIADELTAVRGDRVPGTCRSGSRMRYALVSRGAGRTHHRVNGRSPGAGEGCVAFPEATS